MNELPETRHSLLLKLGQQSEDAWGEFIAVYEQAIYRFCRTKGLQDADALDVTQTVLAAVHNRIDSWDNDSSKGTFRGWLFRVARNTVVDTLVDRSRQAARGGDTALAAVLANQPEDNAARERAFLWEYRRCLFQHAAARVREEVRLTTWKAFWLTAIEGQDPAQVAERLEISVGTVYTAKCRVVARMRSRVAELGEGPDHIDPTFDPDLVRRALESSEEAPRGE